MNKDIQFLKELQAELNSQSNDCQASPRFWAVGDYRWEVTVEGNAERYSVYLPNCGESSEINKFYQNLEHDDLEGEALEALGEVDSTDESSIFDWIQEHYDDGATLIPERKEHFIRQNTMFLTKQEAKDHIESNYYHYTKEAHTYAMTAWRAPKVERLFKILSEFDFERFCSVTAIIRQNPPRRKPAAVKERRPLTWQRNVNHAEYTHQHQVKQPNPNKRTQEGSKPK